MKIMAPMAIHHFSEKVALVSDASSQIGRAISIQLALQGCFVIGLFPGENGEKGGSLNELAELGTLAYALDIDASTAAGAVTAAAEVSRLFGRLDLLVNCLKFRPQSLFPEVTESDFLDIVGRNLGSVHFLTQAVFDLMKDRPKPKIVSLLAGDGAAKDHLFAATQAGIAAMTQSLARTLPSSFRTNCVAVAEGHVNENAEKSSVAPDEVARAVLFLLSAESIAMNGQVITLG